MGWEMSFLSKSRGFFGFLAGVFFALGAMLFVIYFWNLDRRVLTSAYQRVKDKFDLRIEKEEEQKGENRHG